MTIATPLPELLVDRYRTWKRTRFAEAQKTYQDLAAKGQTPIAMVIACCDSRVNATMMFGAGPGELFIHRNIANLVPSYAPGHTPRATSAAIEYAVCSLDVSHIMVLGHSSCGGVRECHDLCSGNAPELDDKSSFVGGWLEILRPAYERVSDMGDEEARIDALEHEGVVLSLENLMTFPFVKEAVERGDLELHGLWNDIGEGGLHVYDGKGFNQIT